MKLLETKNADLTNGFQKFIAGIMGVGALAALYFLLPPLVEILKNLVMTIGLGLVVAFLAFNYENLWMLLKQSSWSMTKKIISSNKLWHMWQGYYYVLRKNDELRENINQIGAIKSKTNKELVRITQEADKAKEEAIFAEKKEGVSPAYLKVLRNKVALYETQFSNIEPRLKFIEFQYGQLVQLLENRQADAIIMEQTLKAKEQEYEIMKSMSDASNNALSFLNKNSPEMKAFQESVKQIETSIDVYTANVEDFQRTVLPQLQSMETQRELNEEQGKKLIEEFKLKRLSITA